MGSASPKSDVRSCHPVIRKVPIVAVSAPLIILICRIGQVSSVSVFQLFSTCCPPARYTQTISLCSLQTRWTCHLCRYSGSLLHGAIGNEKLFWWAISHPNAMRTPKVDHTLAQRHDWIRMKRILSEWLLLESTCMEWICTVCLVNGHVWYMSASKLHNIHEWCSKKKMEQCVWL